jgi:hypothetical protein
MVAGNCTYLMRGHTVEGATPVRPPVIRPSPGSFDNGYSGISSTYHHAPSGIIYAFIHGEDHLGMPPTSYNPKIPSGYWSIGLALSRDGGESFRKQGRILTPCRAKFSITMDSYGIGDPSVVCHHKAPCLLLYYTNLSFADADPSVGIGIAGCALDVLDRPRAWHKWSGLKFSEPGQGGTDKSIITFADNVHSDVIQPHVQYVAEWRLYVMLCCVVVHADCDSRHAANSGVFLCTSTDGVTWPRLRSVFTCLPIPYEGCPFGAHPTLVLDRKSLTAEGGTGCIYFCSSSAWSDDTSSPSLPNDYAGPHHLSRTRITLKTLASLEERNRPPTVKLFL